MNWAHPHLLWLLLGPLLLLLGRLGLNRRQRRQQQSLGGSVPALTADQRRQCQAWRLGLQVLALVMGILALARPLGPMVATPVIQAGATVAVVIDCGPHSETTDTAARGRTLIAALLTAAPEHRVALVPYAGVAITLCPPSDDPAAVAFLLDDCRPELFPPPHDQKTVLGAALLTAIETLTSDPRTSTDRAIVVISSGHYDDSEATAQALAALRQHDIALLILSANQQHGPPLQELVAAGDGQLIDLDPADIARQRLVRTLSRLGGEQQRGYQDQAAEHDRWPLLAAVLSLLIALALPQARRLGIAALLALTLFSPAAASEAAAPDLERLRQRLEEEPEAVRAALKQMLINQPEHGHLHLVLGSLLLADDPVRAAAHLGQATIRLSQTTSRLSQTTSLDHAQLAAAAWHNLALAEHLLGRRVAAAQAGQRAAALDSTMTATNAASLTAYADLPPDQPPAARPLIDSGPYQAHEQQPFTQHLSPAESDRDLRFSAEQLPPGLQLDDDGRLHGQAAVGSAGRWSLAVSVTEGSGRRSPCPVQLIIHPAPAITTTRLPATVPGSFYRAVITSVGMARPQWQITGLPSGLRASPQGSSLIISGIPGHSASTQVVVSANEISARLELPVAEAGFASADIDLPPATSGRPYRHQLRLRGPTAAYRWQGGSDALRCHQDGLLSGHVVQPGQHHLDVELIHPDGRRHRDRLQITVKPPPTIDTRRLEIIAGRLVAVPLAHSGGSPPVRWHVVEDLPQGLYLDERGMLGGAAPQPGHYRLHLLVSDRWQAAHSAVIDLIVHGETADQPPPDEADEDDEQEPDDDQPDADTEDDDNGDDPDDETPDDTDETPDDDADDGKDDTTPDQPEPEPEPAEPDRDQQEPSETDTQDDLFGDLERDALRHHLDGLPPERRGALLWISPSIGRQPDPEQPWEAAP